MNKSNGPGFAFIGAKFSSRRLENPFWHFCKSVARKCNNLLHQFAGRRTHSGFEELGI